MTSWEEGALKRCRKNCCPATLATQFGKNSKTKATSSMPSAKKWSVKVIFSSVMDFCSIWVCYWLIFSQHSNFIVHFQVQSQVKICSLSQFATTKVMSQLSFLYQLYQLIQLNSLVLESSPKIRLRTKGLSFIIIHMVDMLKQSIAKAILMLLRWFKSGSHVSMIGWIQRTERKHLWLENTLKVSKNNSILDFTVPKINWQPQKMENMSSVIVG